MNRITLNILQVFRNGIYELYTPVGGIGSLNRECAVRPSLRSVAAMPEEAVARAMSPLCRTYDRIVFSRKVFPVPPFTKTFKKKYIIRKKEYKFVGDLVKLEVSFEEFNITDIMQVE